MVGVVMRSRVIVVGADLGRVWTGSDCGRSGEFYCLRVCSGGFGHSPGRIEYHRQVRFRAFMFLTLFLFVLCLKDSS